MQVRKAYSFRMELTTARVYGDEEAGNEAAMVE